MDELPRGAQWPAILGIKVTDDEPVVRQGTSTASSWEVSGFLALGDNPFLLESLPSSTTGCSLSLQFQEGAAGSVVVLLSLCSPVVADSVPFFVVV